MIESDLPVSLTDAKHMFLHEERKTCTVPVRAWHQWLPGTQRHKVTHQKPPDGT